MLSSYEPQRPKMKDVSQPSTQHACFCKHVQTPWYCPKSSGWKRLGCWLERFAVALGPINGRFLYSLAQSASTGSDLLVFPCWSIFRGPKRLTFFSRSFGQVSIFPVFGLKLSSHLLGPFWSSFLGCSQPRGSWLRLSMEDPTPKY